MEPNKRNKRRQNIQTETKNQRKQLKINKQLKMHKNNN